MILVTSFSQRSKITTSGGLINEVRNKVEAMEKAQTTAEMSPGEPTYIISREGVTVFSLQSKSQKCRIPIELGFYMYEISSGVFND